MHKVGQSVDNQSLLRRDLEAGVAELGLTIDSDVAGRLLELIRLLAKWNRAYNLTAITEPRDMLHKHVLDSLSLQPFLHGQRILDVGTGGGFPGLPLALLNPDREFVLLDSHAKKLRFIEQAAADLGLANVTTVHSRVEQYAPDQRFSSITSRAFASLEKIISWTEHLLEPGGHILAMKGHLAPEELECAGDGWQIEVNAVVVPFIDGARHIVVIRRN